MRRNPLPFLAIALTVSLSGCSKQATSPAAPPPPPVPELVASEPPARTPLAIYDTPIWAQFDRALARSTVTTLNVYLKLDGQRVPITLAYDDALHRVTITPTVILQLERTYTVEFSTAVTGVDGTPLAPGVFFQFTTNSLRRPPYDFPLTSDVEGPLAALGWGGTQGPTNNIMYEVYASTDSDAVKARSVPFLARSVFTRFLPNAPWPLGKTIYWALTSENLTTHERMDGAFRTFQTIDPSSPLDSIGIGGRDHGSRGVTNTIQQCTNASFSCGPTFNAALHWSFVTLPADARIQSVSMRLNTAAGDANTINAAQPTLWLAQNDWINCQIIAPGPPFAEGSGLLASGTAESANVVLFQTPRLGALLEAQFRNRTLLFGTLVRSNNLLLFQSTSAADGNLAPRATIRFYHLPPAARP